MKISRVKFLLQLLLIVFPSICLGQTAKDYFKVIQENGTNPVEFVQQKLETIDLIIFDDAMHSALEPFNFYQKLIEAKDSNIDVVFIEAFSIDAQADIDAYLKSANKDSTLLLKAFQNSFGGYGWRYETYLALLSAIWDVNHNLPASEKIKVIGVDQPIYWEGIHNRKDYDIFINSLVGRDYFMYKIIIEYMNNFKDNKKGIFLTNTRHAYKQIKNSDGNLYWNCGTFFNQWHPDKSYNIRIHNVTLSIEAKKTKTEQSSTEGLDQYEYKWRKMENGLWDEAFKMNLNKAVAFSFKNNAFGNAKYIGNHMLNVAENQTMYDAYDALVFLAPLENLHFSAKMSFIYTESFKTELKRRIKILEEGNIEKLLAHYGLKTIEEYIEQVSAYTPIRKNNVLSR